jgi:hypothetical protein
MDKLGTEIVKRLNKGRTPAKHLKSAEQVHKERFSKHKRNLAAELAPLNKSPAELVDGIKELGYEVTRDNENNVSILFPGAKRPSRYNKDELLCQIAEIPVVIERVWKPKEWPNEPEMR